MTNRNAKLFLIKLKPDWFSLNLQKKAMKVIIEQLSENEISKRGIKNWPVWEKEVSVFDWYYDSKEQCLFLEGDVMVKTPDGEFQIKKGDFVTFNEGLKCTWHVKKPVRKHYKFY